MNKYLLLLVILGSIFFRAEGIYAVTTTDAFKLQQQVQILNSQIHNLESLQKGRADTGEVLADAYLVIGATDNNIILEKNSSQQYTIASLTKLMNAVVTLEHVSPKTTVRLTKSMLKPEGQSPAIFLNLKISVKNLLQAALTQSVNDAAQALAYAVGSGRFVKLMNAKAKALRMENTIYYDVHGLNPKNVSTAVDLSKLAAYIYQQHPEILTMTKNNNFWLPDAKGRLLKFKNLNNFYTLPDFLGGKTGYLVEAKETMVSVFNINDKPTIIVVLHSDNANADTLKLVAQAKAAA